MVKTKAPLLWVQIDHTKYALTRAAFLTFPWILCHMVCFFEGKNKITRTSMFRIDAHHFSSPANN
jgi:hypothetical protein